MVVLRQDLRLSLRTLLKRPLFTTVVLITIGLGIGVNTTIFSIVNGVLLKPLAYHDSDRLVMVWQSFQKEGWTRIPFSGPDYLDFKSQSTSFDDIAAAYLDREDFSLTGQGEPEQVPGMPVSANLFSTLGVQPVLGRNFRPEEDQHGNERVVILSFSLFQRKFGGDPSVVGRSVAINGQPYTVIGVMPAGFQFPPPISSGSLVLKSDRDLWMPYVIERRNRYNHSLAMIGRLNPRVTPAQAAAEADVLARSFEEQHPDSNTGVGINVSLMQELVVRNIRPALWLLIVASGLVLLIGCANVANLIMVRAFGRRREMAVRAALGASRTRLVRQALTENMLLTVVGGGAGLLLAVWGIDFLRSQGGATVPRINETQVDFKVLLFTLALSVLTGLLFGLPLAIQSSQSSLAEWLKDSGRTSGSVAATRFRSTLVMAEVALAIVLLIGGGLLLRSFIRLIHIDPGFNPDNVLTAGIRLPSSRYGDVSKVGAFTRQLIERARSLPGVVSVATTNTLPIIGFKATTEFYIEGRPHPATISEASFAGRRVISEGYFSTMNIPVLEGRPFTSADRIDSPSVVVISQALARRYFTAEDPIGKRIKIDSEEAPWSAIIGVVGDVHHSGLATTPEPEFYSPQSQGNWNIMALVVRSSGDPTALAAAVREQIWAIDKDQPVFNVRTMNEIVSDSVATRRFSLLLLNGFAALAMLLSALGVYGVISYSVAQRTQEIGIRMALGARRYDVLMLVFRNGVPPFAGGVAIGIGIALIATRVMASLLFATSATDLPTFLASAALIGLVGSAACYVPARRAAQVDPMVALRCE